jgi:hypothetical protein
MRGMKTKLYLFLLIQFFNSVSGALATMVVPSADRLIRLGVVGGDAVMLLLAFSAFWTRREFYGVKYMALFLLVSTLTFIYTVDRFGFAEHLNGLRETLYFFSSMVVVYDLYESYTRPLFAKIFTSYLIVFAIVQTPVAILQFLKFGAGDPVGGTYGTAGGSGYISQLLFLICFYFVVRYASLADGSNFSVSRTILAFPILIPCALNETKISFLLLAGFLALLISSPRKIYRAVPLLILGLGLMYLLNYYYTQTVEDTRTIFDEDFIEKYLLTNPTGTGGDLPRLQRIQIMFHIMGGDIGSILLGMGYGVLGGGNIMSMSRLGRSLYYLVTGSRVLLFRVWIQGGLIAAILVAANMFAYLRSRVEKTFTLRQFSWFLLFSLLVIWVYDEAIFDRVFAPIVAFFMMWIRAGGLDGEVDPTLEPSEEPYEQA